MSRAAKIGDHALLGDCVSAALVSTDGEIDWLCLPRFDSPPVFGALLGEGAGVWRVGPVGRSGATQRYVPGTNVVETRFVTDGGVVVVTDAFTVAGAEERRRELLADREIVRVVRCEAGTVEVESFFDPRPLGRRHVALEDTGALGVRVRLDDGLLVLRSDLERDAGDPRRARARLRAGEQRHLALTFADGPAVLTPLGEPTVRAVERTIAWWRRWVEQCTYDGPRRDRVVRSALALRLLSYAPSGAIVAAPTTSLPERLGGPLNWDYRYCWLRDAALTVRALLGVGYGAEADAFVTFLLHATRSSWPQIEVLYDVYGRKPHPERLVDLPGYAGSRPVRIGNAAADQLQLDVYGEVIEATVRATRNGTRLDHETRGMLASIGEWVCRHWDQPDEGIWEPRHGRQHHTHSRLMCWTALDCLLRMCEEGQLADIPRDRFEKNRIMLRAEIEERAWNEERGAYVGVLDGDELDAAVLLLAQHGFEPASSERMRRTVAAVRRELGATNDLVFRYRPRREEDVEGAFVICSFWAAEVIAMGAGTLDEAEALFDSLCARANHVGLLSEEIDPGTGELLGNFPQGFSHVGLVNTALSLVARRRREARRAPSHGERRTT